MTKSKTPYRVLSKPIYGRGVAYYVYNLAAKLEGKADDAVMTFYRAPRNTEGDPGVITTTEFLKEFKVGDSVLGGVIVRFTEKTIFVKSPGKDEPVKVHISNFSDANVPNDNYAARFLG